MSLTKRTNKISKAKKTRTPVTDEDCIAFVFERYAPLKNGGGSLEPIKNIAQRHSRNPGVISRAIFDAFRKGLVEIVSAERIGGTPLRRNEGLETRLVDRFTCLKNAIVIESNASPPASDLKGRKAYDDNVHQQLGTGLAHSLAKNPVNFDNARIALSSGRGVYYVVDTLRNLSPIRARGVTIMSLTGSMFARDHSSHSKQMDADFNVTQLGACFNQRVSLETLCNPLAPEPNQLKRILGSTCLASWETCVPDYAIVGVGVLYHGHRFWEYAKGPDSPSVKQFIAPVYDELKKLVYLCEQYSEHSVSYCPVADIANHLFFVEPPEEVPVLEADRLRIQELIAIINGGLLNVRKNQLQSIRTLMLVAGTTKKAAAIRQLLCEFQNLKYLATDSVTAQAILEEPE